MRMVGERSRNGRDGWERAGCMYPPQEGGCATVSLLNTSLIFLDFLYYRVSGGGKCTATRSQLPHPFSLSSDMSIKTCTKENVYFN